MNDYNRARSMFAKARVTRTPVFKTAEKMFELMNNWDLKFKIADPILAKYNSGEELSDSTKLSLSGSLFAIGRIHEELENKDSVLHYYGLAVKYAPISKPESSRFYHAYARVMKPHDAQFADSLLDIIVMNHPLTDFGKDAQAQLGYTNNFVIDTVAELYTSGLNLMRIADYNYSINQFTKLYSTYPKSKYSPASIYTIGWIFEKYLRLPDSALVYYKILLNDYPESEYAKDINLGVAYKLAVNSGEPIPDSLKERQLVVQPKPLRSIPQKGNLNPQSKQINHRREQPDPRQLLKDPSSILKDAEGLMQNPVELLKGLDMPTEKLQNPLDVLKSEGALSPATADTSNIVIPVTEEPKK
jgi:tetratricopeptide (TPR) repeat protein